VPASARSDPAKRDTLASTARAEFVAIPKKHYVHLSVLYARA
jgi:hypothetical protein